MAGISGINTTCTNFLDQVNNALNLGKSEQNPIRGTDFHTTNVPACFIASLLVR
ncbi:hypothetical protein OAA27_02080 [bacterium]|nr:hypothetical protein [bacterium]